MLVIFLSLLFFVFFVLIGSESKNKPKMIRFDFSGQTMREKRRETAEREREKEKREEKSARESRRPLQLKRLRRLEGLSDRRLCCISSEEKSARRSFVSLGFWETFTALLLLLKR